MPAAVCSRRSVWRIRRRARTVQPIQPGVVAIAILPDRTVASSARRILRPLGAKLSVDGLSG